MNEVRVPIEKLKEQRQQVLVRYRKRKQRNKLVVGTISSIAVLCLVFTLSIRVSPAFANYVAKIPGFAPIVELIEDDKGMQDVLKDGYFEEVAESAASTEHHITLTVVGVIADYSGLAIAYTLEAPRPLKEFGHPDIEISQNGQQIDAGFTYDYTREDNTRYLEDVIMLTSSEGLDFNSKDFTLSFTFDDIGETVQVPFTLKGDIHAPKTIAENIELELQGQKLTIASIVTTPMRAILKFDVAEENDMQIIAVDGFKLIDERGEEWATIRNGMLATGSLRDNTYTMFMESNYYREPEKLTLKIGSIAALPKGKDYIEVDFETGEFVYLPNLPKFDFELKENHLSVTYERNEKGFQALGWGMDEKGHELYDASFRHDEKLATQIIEPSKSFVNPVRFNVDYYPNFIGENLEIEL